MQELKIDGYNLLLGKVTEKSNSKSSFENLCCGTLGRP